MQKQKPNFCERHGIDKFGFSEIVSFTAAILASDRYEQQLNQWNQVFSLIIELCFLLVNCVDHKLIEVHAQYS